MASLEDLKSVLRETLEQRGALNDIKARIRAEIFTALDADSVGRPRISNENMIINELIREYLEYNKYYSAASVLATESGQPANPAFDREYIRKKLQIPGKSGELPMLYEIIFGVMPKFDKYEGEEEAAAIHDSTDPRPISFKK